MISNAAAILAHLNLPKYDVVRDMIRASFAAQVARAANEWYQQVLAFDVTYGHGRNEHQFPRQGVASGYLNNPKTVDAAVYGLRNAAIKEAVTAGRYRIDAAKVQKTADGRWEGAKAFYAARVGEKIDALLEGEAQVECDLELNCFLVGSVKATVGEKILMLDTSLKTNYRYGEFAANRDMTVYRQVPTLVRWHKGFDLPAREAAIVRETEAAKDARRAEIGKWQKEILSLEKAKRVWDDIHHSLDYVAKYEKYEPLNQRHVDAINQKLAKLSLPPMVVGELTAKAAFAKIKELRVALKAAKLTLREVRQPKLEAVS